MNDIDFNNLVFNDDGYADIVPPIVPNTSMKARRNSAGTGIQSVQTTPNSGYVLHDKNYDEEIIDPFTLMPTGEIKLGYRPTTANCGYNYEFTPVQVVAVNGQTVTAYGSREFYAIPESEVPADQIYSGGDNHETI